MHRFLPVAAVAAFAAFASAGETFQFDDPSGLSAEVEFTLVDPMTLVVRARNTSTAAPVGFDSADQLLTGVSWEFPEVGMDTVEITGGSVVIGASSQTVNFSTGSYGPGTDVSGEFGFGNGGGSGQMTNFVSGNTAQATPFGGANLDGPVNLSGPQGGLISATPIVPIGGLGAIEDEIVATLALDTPLPDLAFLAENGVQVEFGSDAAFIVVPEPATLLLLVVGGVLLGRPGR